jgi:DNA-binding protein H-NS
MSYEENDVHEDAVANAVAGDFEDLGTQELRDLVDRIAAEIKHRNRERIKTLRDEVAALAEEMGMTAEELILGTSAGGARPRTKAAPKYRDPENPSKTWTGRGKSPNWYRDRIEAGHSPESMLI